VGYNYGSAVVTNCYITGSVRGFGWDVGGLLGFNGGESTVANCYSTNVVTGNINAGGLVGSNYSNSTIYNCYSTGAVDGGDFSGGLVGYSNNSQIINSYSTGNINGRFPTGDSTGGDYAGGLVGINGNYSKITNCYSAGVVNGGQNTGGLVGSNEGHSEIIKSYSLGYVVAGFEIYVLVGGLVGTNADFSKITNCYSRAVVIGNNYDYQATGGGLVGVNYNNSIITNSYSIGHVTGTTYIGGLCGNNNNSATILNSFWDTQTSGTSTGIGGGTSTGATGKTTAEMKTPSTFYNPPASWASSIWVLDVAVNDGYPYFSTGTSAPVVGGEGPISFNSPGNITSLSIGINPGGGSGNITVSKIDDTAINITGILGYVSDYRWVITQTGLNSGFSGQVRFKLSDLPSNGGITNPTTVTVYSRPYPGSGTFVALPTTYDAVAGELVATITHFSEFVFGSDNPLPVELISFSGTAANNKVTLNWQTATEVNNYGFEVERKLEVKGQTGGASTVWEKVGFIEGSGNSNSEKSYSFVDDLTLNHNLTLNNPAPKVQYRLKQIDNDGTFSYSNEVEVEIKNIPTKFAMEQNYPNPFNPSTKIKYSIPSNVKSEMLNVTLKIYDILGNEVATLVNEPQEPGYYEIDFNAKSLASGVYIYRLQYDKNVSVKKMIMMK
jgi:hypothetical protein